MHYGPLDLLLMALYVVVRFVLLLILWKGNFIRKWPALTVLCITEIVSSITLKVVAGNYHVYYYTYWVFAALGSLLTLGALRDVVCAIPGTPFVPRQITTFLTTVAGTITLVFAIIRYEPVRDSHSVLPFVLAINDGVQTAWYILFLALLGSISFLGFGWPSLPLEIATGFVWYGIASTASAHIIARWPRYGATVDHIYCFAYLCVFVFWSLCFRKNSR